MADNRKPLDQNDVDATPNVWGLEDRYPEIADLLSSAKIKSAADDNVILVLDTNVLLLPFNVGGEELQAIEDVYKKLIEQKRLFIPERVVREYLKNRDTILANILKNTRDKCSLVTNGVVDIAPFLTSLAVSTGVTGAATALKQAQKDYLKTINALAENMLGWRGDDPVTVIYNNLFVGDVLILLEKERADVESAWLERSKNKVPPGYKDGAKADTGIGDFLIWLTILEIGRIQQKDLIFVTGEEKADWCVRANKEGLYPRPELIDEYRRASGGKKFQIGRIADILTAMKVSEKVVNDIREADVSADPLNSSYHRKRLDWARKMAIATSDIVNFDYSTNNGSIILSAADGTLFDLRFSKASDRSIHFLSSPTTNLIARAKNIVPGEIVQLNSLDSTSTTYTIRVGEVFVAEHQNGSVLIGRILGIKDDSRDDLEDHVTFSYRTFNQSDQLVAP